MEFETNMKIFSIFTKNQYKRTGNQQNFAKNVLKVAKKWLLRLLKGFCKTRMSKCCPKI